VKKFAPIYAALLAATVLGTISQGLLAPVVLSALEGTSRPGAVLDFLGKLITAVVAIAVYLYYSKRLANK
jgi:hypothetical protein